jgi:transposase
MMVDEILKQLSPQFNKMYAKVGRPSIPPEQLLRAQLLQMLYSVRSERLLIEERDGLQHSVPLVCGVEFG